MASIQQLALQIVPKNLKEKYLEVWLAEQNPAGRSGIRGLVAQVHFLWLCIRLRWQDDGFRVIRVTVWLACSIVILWLYAEIGFLRDLLELLIVWHMANSLDFRAAHSRRALKATRLHLGVSFTSLCLAVVVHTLGALKAHSPVGELHWIALFANWTLGVSFLTAVGASICWFVDFWTTRNVLITGKLFSTLAAVFLGILWLQQLINVSNLIDPSSSLSSALKSVSRIQQVTTNLILPLLLALSALHFFNKIKRTPKAIFAKQGHR